MLNKPKKDEQKTCGFTLIEVLVVIFIITIGLLAVFNVIQNITVHSRVAASRLTAVYLAQEGVEMIRNQRDSNWLASATWDDNILLMTVPNCTTGPILGKFYRTCTSTSIPLAPKPGIVVSAGVRWQERGAWHSVTSTTELYNWND